MTKTVVSVSEDAPVQAVARLLLDNQVGAVPVTDPSGAPLGMVSDGDLLRGRKDDDQQDLWLNPLAQAPVPLMPEADSRSVRNVMTSQLIRVSPYTPVREVVRMLQTHRIKRLPVVLEGKLPGIISRTDYNPTVFDGYSDEYTLQSSRYFHRQWDLSTP